MIRFREATQADVAAVVALLSEDDLGPRRDADAQPDFPAVFAAMQAEGLNHLIVGERQGVIVATYQIAFIAGLSLRASRRAQVEGVRVRSDLRGQGIGHRLMADAEARARAAGCSLIQLTTQIARTEAHRFYAALGFTPSHIGYKRDLS